MALVGNAYGEVKRLRAQLGHFAALLDKFSTRNAVIRLATQDQATHTMRKALFDYHNSVLGLAHAAGKN